AYKKSQDVYADATVIFQTMEVTMRLLASDGTTELNGGCEYLDPANGWQTFGGGTTPTTMELLPIQWYFRISYVGASMNKVQDVFVNPMVIFVHCGSGPIVDLGADTAFVYWADNFFESATITASVSSGVSPFSYNWSNGHTTQEITVMPYVSTNYSLTVTDANGCSGTDEVFVKSIDARCGNNLNKILICHIPNGNNSNPHTICVSQNAVPALLAQGDLLGPCVIYLHKSVKLNSEYDYLKVFPNPFVTNTMIEFGVETESRILLELFNVNGEKVDQLFQGFMDVGEIQTIDLNANKLNQGLYFIRMRTGSGTYFEKIVLVGE
ncbi:T9SS type A sorting domain-containing protein, partial [Bacteroidota bacterium]